MNGLSTSTTAGWERVFSLTCAAFAQQCPLRRLPSLLRTTSSSTGRPSRAARFYAAASVGAQSSSNNRNSRAPGRTARNFSSTFFTSRASGDSAAFTDERGESSRAANKGREEIFFINRRG